MPEIRCTCGTTAPEGAEYCPLCGRPLTPEALARDRLENAMPPKAVSPPKISIGNPLVLRACYWNAVIAALFSSLPWAAALCFLWFPAAGFFSVASYRRRSGFQVSVRDGVKIGAILGVLAFAMWLVLFSLSALAVEGGFSSILDEAERQFREGGDAETADALARAASDPMALALSLLLALVGFFAVSVALGAVGGAVGARTIGARESSA